MLELLELSLLNNQLQVLLIILRQEIIISSAAILITWKAPSDNEYNLRNAVWEHYVTIIEKLFGKEN